MLITGLADSNGMKANCKHRSKNSKHCALQSLSLWVFLPSKHLLPLANLQGVINMNMHLNGCKESRKHES